MEIYQFGRKALSQFHHFESRLHLARVVYEHVFSAILHLSNQFSLDMNAFHSHRGPRLLDFHAVDADLEEKQWHFDEFCNNNGFWYVMMELHLHLHLMMIWDGMCLGLVSIINKKHALVAITQEK